MNISINEFMEGEETYRSNGWTEMKHTKWYITFYACNNINNKYKQNNNNYTNNKQNET